jgi:hypothetical protein
MNTFWVFLLCNVAFFNTDVGESKKNNVLEVYNYIVLQNMHTYK